MLQNGLSRMARKSNLRYVELRPITWKTSAHDLTAGRSYWLHSLDLSSSLDRIVPESPQEQPAAAYPQGRARAFGVRTGQFR